MVYKIGVLLSLIMSAVLNASDAPFDPRVTVNNQSKHILLMRAIWRPRGDNIEFTLEPGQKSSNIKVPHSLYFVPVQKGFNAQVESERFGYIAKGLPVAGDYGENKPWCLIDVTKQPRKGKWKDAQEGHEPYWISSTDTPLISKSDITSARQQHKDIVFTVKDGNSRLFVADAEFIAGGQDSAEPILSKGFFESLYGKLQVLWRSWFGR